MNFREQLVFQINVINRKLTAKTNQLLRNSGLETSSFFLLCHLNENDVKRTGSLEHELNMERTTLSRSFGVLAKQGYCKSAKNPNDRRVCLHVITPKGKSLVSAYAKSLAELQASFLLDEKLKAISEILK